MILLGWLPRAAQCKKGRRGEGRGPLSHYQHVLDRAQTAVCSGQVDVVTHSLTHSLTHSQSQLHLRGRTTHQTHPLLPSTETLCRVSHTAHYFDITSVTQAHLPPDPPPFTTPLKHTYSQPHPLHHTHTASVTHPLHHTHKSTISWSCDMTNHHQRHNDNLLICHSCHMPQGQLSPTC